MLAVYPGLLIFATVMAVNFVGDGVSSAFDPRAETSQGRTEEDGKQKSREEEMKSVKSVPISFAKVHPGRRASFGCRIVQRDGTSQKSQLVVGQLQFLTNFHPLVQVNNTKRLVINYSLRPMTAFDENVDNHCILCETLPTIDNGLAKSSIFPMARKE